MSQFAIPNCDKKGPMIGIVCFVAGLAVGCCVALAWMRPPSPEM